MIQKLQDQQTALAAQQIELAAHQASLDALVSHLASLGGSASSSASNYSLSTSYATKTSTTIAIPSGSTRAVVIGTVTAQAFQVGTTTPDALNVRAVVTGPGGQSTTNQLGLIPFGGSPAQPAFPISLTANGLFTGLSGGTLTFRCDISTTEAASGASVNNVASVQATAIFLP